MAGQAVHSRIWRFQIKRSLRSPCGACPRSAAGRARHPRTRYSANICPLNQATDGYHAMDQRRTSKLLMRSNRAATLGSWDDLHSETRRLLDC